VSSDGSRWTRGIRLPGTGPWSPAGGDSSAADVRAAGGLHGFVATVASGAGTAAFHSRDGLHWLRVAFSRSRERLAVLTATASGFLAVGTVCCDTAIAWTSRDGTSWRRSVIERAAFVNSATGGPGGLYASGGIDSADDNGSPSPAIWRSGDGVRWTRVAGIEGLFPVGSIASLPSGRLEALSSVGGWTSTDGTSWQANPDLAQQWTVLGAGDALLAIGTATTRMSGDGLTWAPVDAGPSGGFADAASNGRIAVLLQAAFTRSTAIWVLAPPTMPVASHVCPPARPSAAQYLALSALDRLACYGARSVRLRVWIQSTEAGLELSPSRSSQQVLVDVTSSMSERIYRLLPNATGFATVELAAGGSTCPSVTDIGVEPAMEPPLQGEMDCHLDTLIVGIRR
jgi:hypothetical protein